MMVKKVNIDAGSTIPRLSFPRLKPWVTKSAMPTALCGLLALVMNPRLKPQVTRSAMPTAFGVTEYVVSASAIGTTHFVTAEFISLNYATDIETTSAIGTTNFVTWEFIPLPYLKTNRQWKM